MDLLRNLGSAAVSTLVQKSGLNLPFTLGEKNTYFEGRTIWSLYDGTKRDDGSKVSIFIFDSNQPPRRNLLPLAKNALRKLRTVRHPDVLKFIDTADSDSIVYIMTEHVRPLGQILQSYAAKDAKEREEWLLWGLQRISTALAFVNDPCASTHGNVRVDSIFLSPSGEWKLGGFELLSNSKDDQAVLYTLGSVIADSSQHASPEVKKAGWSSLKEHHPSVADAYALGLLIHSVFNPNAPLPATAEPPHPPPSASSRGAIPTSIFTQYKKLLNPNPKARMAPAGLLEAGMAQTGAGCGFFANNIFVRICEGLDQFSIKGEAEKAALLRSIKDAASTLPPEFASHRVLPSLVSALEFGGATANTILPIVLQLGVHASPTDYPSIVLAPVTKLFASPDRGTRMALLEHLPEYADKLDKKTVSDKIWPHLQTGFTDTVAVIREATVKSIGLLYPKFNDRILNNDLLRHLAKMQSDPETAIRTNTCILIGRLGPSLGYNTKKKVLIPAFARALKDSFVHARVAALMAFMATIECFDAEDLASKVIPCISFTLIDKEKLVRDQAFKAMELFVKKLETHAASMPEIVLNVNGQPNVPLPGPVGQNALVSSAAGAASTLAGWAMTSLSKKLVPGDLQSVMATASSAPSTALRTNSAPAPPTLNGSASTLRGTSVASPSASMPSSPGLLSSSTGKARGMQLGASKRSAADAAGVDAWASEDLMDVNADQDDWTAFESAPQGVKDSAAASTLGFDEAPTFSTPTLAVDESDDWGTMDDGTDDANSFADAWGNDLNAPQPTRSRPSTISPSTSATAKVKASPRASSPSILPAKPSLSSRTTTSETLTSSLSPATSPPRPTTPTQTVPMTKEEKAAEMARRKEERKQRIAMLKEHKKHAAPKT
ncbi:CEX1 [Sanghuangporus weigelae]